MTSIEFLQRKEPNSFAVPPEWLREFARIHVKAALESAAEEARMTLHYPEPYSENDEDDLSFISGDDISRRGEYGSVRIDENTILNAYPAENIE